MTFDTDSPLAQHAAGLAQVAAATFVVTLSIWLLPAMRGVPSYFAVNTAPLQLVEVTRGAIGTFDAALREESDRCALRENVMPCKEAVAAVAEYDRALQTVCDRAKRPVKQSACTTLLYVRQRYVDAVNGRRHFLRLAN